MKTDYAVLDAEILAAIGDTPVKAAALQTRAVLSECRRIAEAASTRRSPFGVSPYRVLDRRLQVLRKAGKIESTTKGWVRA